MGTRLLFGIVVTVFLSACTGDPVFDKRREYWDEETERFFHSTRNVPELVSWLEAREIEYTHDHHFTEDDLEHIHALDLEMTTKSNFNCSWQTVSLRFKEDAEGTIVMYDLYNAGDCIFGDD